jgi:phage terminase large subunit-like protein
VPRRRITHPAHDQKRALWIAVWWIETLTVHGPGDVQGEPSLLVPEYADFIIDCYALDEDGRRLYDSAFFSRPKGCDKSGLAAKIALFEALGPCRFDGFAKGGEVYEYLGYTYEYSPGEPMGRTVTTPYVRIMATEEGQTGNVYDTIYYNLTDEAAPLSPLRGFGLDAGLTRISLPYGGEITPSTAGAASKDGGKETFVVFDESHLYVTPQLRQMYSTVTRNLRKRKRIAETWFIETTTMYAPGQESIAEQTYHLADSIQEKQGAGGTKFRNLRERLLFDHRWGTIEDLSDESTLMKAIQEAYGDALEWNSLEGIIDGIFDPREAENDSRRYFLNALTSARNAWVTPDLLTRATAPSLAFDFKPLTPGDTITLGFDGSKNDDATALIACRVSDRALFPLYIEEVPDGPEAVDWQVNREAFDAQVAAAFGTYEVVGFYADPPHWQDYVDAWAREFGDNLRVHASGKHSVEWWTNRDIPMSLALERLHTAMLNGSMVLVDGGGEGMFKTLHNHFLNARVWHRRAGAVIGKDRKGSSFKMDAAVAATLAFEAASDYAAKPLPKKRNSFVPIKVR